MGLVGTFAAADGVSICQPGLEAYQKTLYPLQRKYCISCHGDGGIAVGHSVSDPEKAYTVTRSLINFSDIESSTLIFKFKQKHWQNYGGPQIPVAPEEVSSLIQSWWDLGENVCPKLQDFVSDEIVIPNNLPDRASGKFASVGWDFRREKSPLDGCRFVVDIQRFTKSQPSILGSYRIKNPRISCWTKSVVIKGLWFPINGQIQGFENTYADSEWKIDANSDPTQFTLLSSEYGILLERKADTNSLSVMIDHVKLGN